jgi:hypothetical protein
MVLITDLSKKIENRGGIEIFLVFVRDTGKVGSVIRQLGLG